MSANKKPYCLMPWIHFHINSKGSVNACCVSSIKLGDINNNSINEIWQGKPIKKIREQFLSGKPDKRCGVCINRENGGAKSIRQETFEKFPNVNIDIIQKPIYFDIRFSNICNFRCRTCWHGASSKWFNDAKLLNTNLGEKAIITNINDFNDFIEKNGEALKSAQEIYFAGGEPLVTKEHYLLLEFLIDKNITNVRLRYNTNFSVLKFKGYDVLDLWKHFKNVEILASIDESGRLGEYIRKELDWDLFVLNRERIRTFKNIQFKISPTVSVFNIATLHDFYKKCLSLNIIKPNEIYINILDRPFHYSSKVLSKVEKREITKEYELFCDLCYSSEVPLSVIKQFRACIDFMNSEDLNDKYWCKFLEETKKLDKIRNEDFKLV
jgi:organic radical activating enzyme